MQIGIGNIANELLIYSNLIQINTIKEFPYLRAYLSGGNGKSTKCFLYVIQEPNGNFSVCDYPNDSNGEKIIVTGSMSKPFQMEKDLNKHIDERPLNVKKHINFNEFMVYLYDLLQSYNIISYNSNLNDKTLGEIISNKQRLKRIVEQNMKKLGIKGTLTELITRSYINKETIPMFKIKDYEIKYLKSKMRQIGIDITIDSEQITNMNFIAK